MRLFSFSFRCRRRCFCVVALLAVGLISEAYARETATLIVTDPFIELHGGAGRGYPVLEVVEQGDRIEVIERRTSWYRVRTHRGREGWVPRAQMLRTLTPGGEQFHEQEADENDYLDRRYDIGTWLGEFSGSALMGLHGGWRATPNISVEADFLQVVGNNADSRVLDLSLGMHPWPEWKFSPYFALGTGLVQTQPAAVLVSAGREENQSLSVAAGMESWVTQTFVLRLEYRNYLVLTSREDYESMDTWKAGLSVFF